jgi:hypothetical protein
LFVLLAEWGSHSVICSGEAFHDADEQSIAATDAGHEDPCQTLVLCSDGKRHDQQTTHFSHDASQHNALFDRMSGLTSSQVTFPDVQIPRAAADGLFRPKSPPFHPPKQA